jgi:hypothetical protein
MPNEDFHAEKIAKGRKVDNTSFSDQRPLELLLIPAEP